MKRTKLQAVPNISTSQKTPPKTVDRKEFDAQLKEVMGHVTKDPKKAAKIFESWLEQPAKTEKKKRAA